MVRVVRRGIVYKMVYKMFGVVASVKIGEEMDCCARLG